MSVTVLGYIAYFLICAFSWLQLYFSFRGRTINLGITPLVSLAAGLAVLQAALFMGVGTPLYLLVGNGLSLVGTVLNLVRVKFFSARVVPPGVGAATTLEKYAERTLRDNIFDSSAFFDLIKAKRGPTPKPRGLLARLWRRVFKGPRTPVNTSDGDLTGNRIIMEPMNMSGPEPYAPPSLGRQDFDSCKTCGALVWANTNSVSTKVQDVGWLIAHNGSLGGIAFDQTLQTVAVDSYCDRDRPPYDEKVFYPGPAEGAPTNVEYFKYVETPDSDRIRRQVNQDGTNYD